MVRTSWGLMGAQILIVMAALGVVMLLVREQTRALGIKIVGGLAIALLLLVVYVFRGEQSWEYNHEWDFPHAHSEPAAEHSASGRLTPESVVTDHTATSDEAVTAIPLPQDVTTAQQPPVVDEGRPPEPAEEIILEREPEAATVAAARANAAAPVAIAPQDPQPAAGSEKQPADDQRPAWVDQPPRREGDVYIAVASSGPFVTEQECSEAIYVEVQKVVNRVIDELIGPGTSEVVQLDQPYLRRLIDGLCKASYIETRNSSVGPMKIMHVRMEFDDQVRTDLKHRWRQAQLAVRLRRVSGGALWVLALVGAAYSFLKVDTATKGYYTKRLQVTAVVVILAIIAFGLSRA